MPEDARDSAGADLVHAAEQYVTMAGQARTGDRSQGLLRAARARLERTALVYAAACGWQPPAPREEVPAPMA
jgi:hypothetical protein